MQTSKTKNQKYKQKCKKLFCVKPDPLNAFWEFHLLFCFFMFTFYIVLVIASEAKQSQLV